MCLWWKIAGERLQYASCITLIFHQESFQVYDEDHIFSVFFSEFPYLLF